MTARGFAVGDWVLLRDDKGREILVRVGEEGSCHTHKGTVNLASLVDVQAGTWVTTTSGGRLEAVVPSYRDFVLRMPRGAQIIYPKDVAAIIGELSLEPGLRVLEAGTGSGALSVALARAGAQVFSFELRRDFARRAAKNIVAFVPEALVRHHHIVVGDVRDVSRQACFDRLVLDLLAPWAVLPMLGPRLGHGGRAVIYLTNIVQVQSTVAALPEAHLELDRVVELLEREWVVDGDVVRPRQHMVGHTGFLVVARAAGPRRPGDGGDAERVAATELGPREVG